MTIRKSATRPKTRWALLVTVVAALVLATGAVTLAVHDVGEFELDKNATNDLNVSPLGVLGANINDSTTSIGVCTTGTEPALPFTILIEAERMSVTVAGNGSFGGNCGGTKRSYTVDRGFDSTSPAAHQKSGVTGNVSLLVEQTKDGPDWNDVHATVGADPDCSTLGLIECSFVEDGIGPTTFIGGASKDHLDIDGWMHTSGASPDKAEILNAYAAKAIDDNGDQILYFGMDRYAVDGSTDIGFWFFRGEVTANEDGTFSGEHQGTLNSDPADNDILALATFTQGGAATNIRVFRWVGSGGNESGTVNGPDADAGDCVPPPPDVLTDDDLCGTVNNTTIEVPWNYTFKGAAAGSWVPAGGMFEGGINLTALGLEGCFSSFLAETRSSPEITAILKDFTLGAFEACDTEITTTPKDGAGGNLTSDSDNDGLSEISIGSGSVQVTDSAELEVKGTSTFTGSLNFYLCGPIANPTACSTSGVEIGAGTGVNPVTANGTYSSAAATVTEVGRYCWYATFTSGTEGVPDAADGTIEVVGPPSSTGECFEVLPVTPSLDTDAGDGPVDFGQSVTDTATLAGTATQPGTLGPNATYPSINPTVAGIPAGGTITFQLYGPFTSGTPTPTECGGLGLAAGFATAHPSGIQRSVSGNGTYPTVSQDPVSFVPEAPGWYFWKASYDGNSPNTNPSGEHNTNCADADEAVLVRQIPTTIKTQQSWYPNDTAQIASSVVGDNLGAGGTVDFELYDSATCTGTVLYTERKTLTGGSNSETVSTSNYASSAGVTPSGGTVTPFAITTAYAGAADSVEGPYSWKVVYTPAIGDSAHTGRQSACTTDSTEKFSITYTNDAGPGSNLP